MHNANFKKWVGLLILVIALSLGFNLNIENVYAGAEGSDTSSGCLNARSVYNIKVSNKLNTNGTIEISASKSTKFNIKIMSETTYNHYVNSVLPTANGSGSYDIDEISQYIVMNYKKVKNSLDGANRLVYSNFVLDASNNGNKIALTRDQIQSANNGVASPEINTNVNLNTPEAEFYIIIYPENDNYCTKYWYDSRVVRLTNEPIPSGSMKSIYLNDVNNRTRDAEQDWNNKNYCGWANDVYEDSDGTIKNILKKSMPSCFADGAGNVSYNFSRGNLAKVAKQIHNLYISYEKYLEVTKGEKNLPILDPTKDWKQINNPSNFRKDFSSYQTVLGSNSSTMLTCDAKNEETFKYLYYLDIHTESVTFASGVQANQRTDVCTVQCREDLIVRFGPPKAVIAGECFTYEVEIKSNVNCVTELKVDGLPDVNNYIPSIPVPSCNEIDGYEDQAGPNDEFDSCVAKCDGGKYSQKCIDSCYSKVYEKNNKTTSKAKKQAAFNAYKETTLSLSKVAYDKNNNTGGCPAGTVAGVSYDANGFPNAGNIASVNATVENVYNTMWGNITGNYNPSAGGGMLSYTTKGGGRNACKWYDYSHYYFHDLAMSFKTVCNDYGFNWNSSNPYTCQPANYSKAACSAAWGCYRGKIAYTVYGTRDVAVKNKKGKITGYTKEKYKIGTSYAPYTGVNGFKVNTSCTDSCAWSKVDGKYYNDREAAEGDYVANLTQFISAAIGCVEEASAACKTDQSTYTMTVNHDQDVNKQTCEMGDGLGSNNQSTTCKSWEATGNKTGLSKESQRSILIYNGGNCMENRTDDFMYHDIITFPGSWINNKNGKVSYEIKPNEEKWYTYKDKNYCTPLNAKGVNAPYWRWYQNTQFGATTASYNDWVSSGSADAKSIKYNIISAINKFGHYKWNFDVACFYAIDKDVPTTDETPETPCADAVCATCTNNSCPPKSDGPSVNNYTSRSITSSDMFPSKSNSTNDATVKKLSYVDKLADNSASTSAGRAKGFNWSVNATNLAIEGYPVTPSALVEKIESADSIYVDSEIDYDITLSTTNIRKIRSEAKQHKSNYYTEFKNGTYNTVKGKNYPSSYDNANIPSYSYYTSKFLRDTAYVSSKNVIPSQNGLPCNNLSSSGSCDTTLSGFVNQDQKLIDWLR